MSADRDFISSITFLIGVYRERGLLMVGRYDEGVRLLAFVFGHDADWIADHITKRLGGVL